jgi:hypothetical protein
VTMWIVLTVLSVAVAVLVGWAVPAWAAGRIVKAIQATGGATTNFRGHRVPLGLGLVWLLWAVGVAAAWNLIGFGAYVFQIASSSATAAPPEWLTALGNSPFATVVSALPFMLVVGVVAFGLADDAFGGGGEKGFRGHSRALAGGRLTTGMLKLLGIGALAFVSATGIAGSIGRVDAAAADAVGWMRGGYMVAAWIVATLVIALAVNLVNLTDLRPGRALKAYLPLVLIGAGVTVWGFLRAMESSIAASLTPAALPRAGLQGLPSGDSVWVWLAGSAICLLVLVLGPVCAVWRYDLRERAMLGDAGANAMGAVAGYLLARSAPLWLLGALALVLLALNLASESVSFSSVIERVPVLRWLDGLGRLPSAPAVGDVGAANGEDDGAWAGGPVAEDEKPRRDDVS